MTQNKTESIRFYYNGLRVNGERKLTRCCYTLDNRYDGAECVTIYAKGYDDLPRDIFPVENDSDSYTDYFEHDRATLFPDHPLYKFARYAAMKANTRGNAESIERVSKEIAGMGREPWAASRGPVISTRARPTLPAGSGSSPTSTPPKIPASRPPPTWKRATLSALPKRTPAAKKSTRKSFGAGKRR